MSRHVPRGASRLILTAALYFVLDQKADAEEEKLLESDQSYSPLGPWSLPFLGVFGSASF